MKRSLLTTMSLVVLVVGPAFVGAQDTKSGTKPASQPVAKTAPAAKSPTATPAEPPAKPKDASAAAPSAEEQALRQSGDAYVKAFNQHDAKATAELYTPDAEYIDESGVTTLGRGEIEAGLKVYFQSNPDCQLELTVLSIRVIAPNVAIEDGLTTITATKTAKPVTTRYTAVHSKTAGKWLLASVRDTTLRQEAEHRSRLTEFEWMQGEWVHDGPDASVLFECYPIASGNFLVRDFSVHFAGREAITGSQRIGWDAQAGKFKSWIFDSDGGFAEGYWHRDGASWVLKVTGVTSKGQSASSTSIYTFENAHTMTVQSLDHEIAGVEFPDSPPVKIVRRPPRPN